MEEDNYNDNNNDNQQQQQRKKKKKKQIHFTHVKYITTGSATKDKVSRKWKSRHLLKRGFEYLKNKRYTEAIAFFQKCILREPDLPETYNALGYTMLLKAVRYEEFKRSIPLFTTALKLNPSYAYALYNRGVAYQQTASAMLREKGLKKSDETDAILRLSLNDFTACIKADKFFAKAYHNRACCLALLRQSKKAAGDMTKAIEIFNQESTLHRRYETGNFKVNNQTNNNNNNANGENGESMLSDDSEEEEEKVADLEDEDEDTFEEKLYNNDKDEEDGERDTRLRVGKNSQDIYDDDNEEDSDDDESKEEALAKWKQLQLIQKACDRLHRIGTKKSSRHNFLRSLKARQLIYEKRVEIEESENDREMIDRVTIEMEELGEFDDDSDEDNNSDDEDANEKSNKTKTSKNNGKQKKKKKKTSSFDNGGEAMIGMNNNNNNQANNAQQMIGKAGSLVVKRRKR